METTISFTWQWVP